MDLTFGTWRVAIERLPPTDAHLTAMYNAIAPRWQQVIARHGYPQAYANLVGQLQRDGWFAGIDAQARVLDCGIGTGAVSMALLQHLPLRQIDGVDIAPQMLALARSHLHAAGATLDAHCEDMRTLPFADATFDLVVSAHALEHLLHPAEGVRELVRVARPGASLILIMTRPGVGGSLIQAQWGITHVSPATVQAWLAECGIAPVCRYELNTRWCRQCSFVLVGLKRAEMLALSDRGQHPVAA